MKRYRHPLARIFLGIPDQIHYHSVGLVGVNVGHNRMFGQSQRYLLSDRLHRMLEAAADIGQQCVYITV